MTLRLAPLVLAAVGCSSPGRADLAEHPAMSDPTPARGPASATRCVPAGRYTVRVDLSSAQISQKNTGMDGTEWCRSMLEVVPAQTMTAMTIAYADGQLAVDWSGVKSLSVASDCEFDVTSPPMPAHIIFAGGKGTGTTTYSIGTDNHPDESCTATGAKLTIEPAL